MRFSNQKSCASIKPNFIRKHFFLFCPSVRSQSASFLSCWRASHLIGKKVICLLESHAGILSNQIFLFLTFNRKLFTRSESNGYRNPSSWLAKPDSKICCLRMFGHILCSFFKKTKQNINLNGDQQCAMNQHPRSSAPSGHV